MIDTKRFFIASTLGLLAFLLLGYSAHALTNIFENIKPRTNNSYESGTATSSWLRTYQQYGSTTGVISVTGANGTSTFSGGVTIGQGFSVEDLVSCDTINTDVSGAFTCGTDATGAGSGTFSWTPTGYGVSTSNTLGFLNGFLSTASSTIVGNATTTGRQAGGYIVATDATATSTLAGGLAIETSGFVYDYSSGNVGIGVVNPVALLDIDNANSGETKKLRIGSSNNAGFLNFTYNPTGFIYKLSTDSSASQIHLETAGGNIALMPSGSGNVGIGTSTPGSLLSIQSVGNFMGGTSTIYSNLSVGNITATNTLSTLGSFKIGTENWTSFLGNGLDNTAGVLTANCV